MKSHVTFAVLSLAATLLVSCASQSRSVAELNAVRATITVEKCSALLGQSQIWKVTKDRIVVLHATNEKTDMVLGCRTISNKQYESLLLEARKIPSKMWGRSFRRIELADGFLFRIAFEQPPNNQVQEIQTINVGYDSFLPLFNALDAYLASNLKIDYQPILALERELRRFTVTEGPLYTK